MDLGAWRKPRLRIGAPHIDWNRVNQRTKEGYNLKASGIGESKEESYDINWLKLATAA